MASANTGVFRLYLLRHAHAGWPTPGERDFDRSLDAKGVAEARSVALQAYTAGLTPELLVSSPAQRCSQTAAAFLDVFGDLATRYDPRLYSDGVDAYLDLILAQQHAASLMIVGHNPMIETLAGMLAGEGDGGIARLADGYPTAGLLALDFDRPFDRANLQKGRPTLLLTPAMR